MSQKIVETHPKVRISNVIMVPISQLVPHPKNPNKHTKDQIKRLAEIIEFQGWRLPVKVSNQSGFVTSGHGRIDAAKLKGWEEVPVSRQDYENEAQEYADVVSDNAIAEWAALDLKSINEKLPDMGPDFNIDLLGIKDFTLDPSEKAPPEDPDNVPGVRTETIAKPGDIWKLGNHRVICGDSTNILNVESVMDGAKADMLCWDPPWNVGFEYNQYDDGKSSEEYGDFMSACLNNFQIVANKAYVAVVWQSEKNWLHFHKWFPPQARMVAVTKNFGQMSKGFLQRAWDPAFMWHGPSYEHVRKKEHNQRDYFLSNTAATGNKTPGVRINAGEHPCPRQVDVCEYFIDGWTKSGANVLDLCGGSGTTLIACEKLKRNCFMVEMDPKYCDVIIARWQKYTGQKAELIVTDNQPC